MSEARAIKAQEWIVRADGQIKRSEKILEIDESKDHKKDEIAERI